MNKGFLGKAFTCAAAALISLPLIAAGQSAGILPGSTSGRSYVDFAQTQLLGAMPKGLIRLVRAPDDGLIVQPVGKFREYFDYDGFSFKNTLTDSNISGGEAAAGYAASALFAGAGIGMAAWADKDRKLKNSLEQDGKHLGATLDVAGKFAQASNIFSAIGNLTNNKAAKNAGAAMGMIMVGVLASIPPYLTYKSVEYNFFSDEKKPNRAPSVA